MTLLFGLIALFLVVLVPLFTLGVYYAAKRFWSQDRNRSRTAPPTPPEGIDDENRWRPPRAS